jgi:Phasin protein
MPLQWTVAPSRAWWRPSGSIEQLLTRARNHTVGRRLLQWRDLPGRRQDAGCRRPNPDPDKTQRAADRTADAGAGATRQGAEKLQGQMDAMLGTAGRASQEAARRTGENMELMKRLAETMASGAREVSSEMVEWTRQASERQNEATRQITQARSLEEVLECPSSAALGHAGC